MAAVSGEEVPNPVLRAYADTVHACGIEPETITAFMESMKMDTRVFRYQTYSDLEAYTYGSAAVVGLMMCRVVGVAEGRADAHAEALGVAMQLSNFLRDVGEDWRRGRVYLPLEDLERFGYTEQDLASGVVDERFVALMRFEIDRARESLRGRRRGDGLHPEGETFPRDRGARAVRGDPRPHRSPGLRRLLPQGAGLAPRETRGRGQMRGQRPRRDRRPRPLQAESAVQIDGNCCIGGGTK